MADQVQDDPPDITDQMVEQAARAIASIGLDADVVPDDYWEVVLTEGTRAHHRDRARVALTAGLAGHTLVDLSDPTDAEREALMHVLDEQLEAPGMADWEREQRRRDAAWRAGRLLTAGYRYIPAADRRGNGAAQVAAIALELDAKQEQ